MFKLSILTIIDGTFVQEWMTNKNERRVESRDDELPNLEFKIIDRKEEAIVWENAY